MRGILLILLFPLFVFAGEKQTVALQIAILDGQAITKYGVREREDYLRPLHGRVISIVVDAKPYGALFPARSDARLRAELIKKLSELNIRADEVVTTLVFHTHGSSKSGESELWNIGKLQNDGPDFQFQQVLRKIKNYMSPKLNVVLEACQTMCLPKESNFTRIRSLMNYLGAPDGKFFGALTPIANISDNVNGVTSKELLTIGGVSFMVYSGLSIMSYFVQDPEFNQTIIAGGSLAFASLLTLAEVLKSYAMKPWIKLNEHWRKINVGWVFQLENGEAVKVRETKFYKEIDQIYSPSQACAKLLSAS